MDEGSCHSYYHKFLNSKVITIVLFCLFPLTLLHIYLVPLSFNQQHSPLPFPSPRHNDTITSISTSTSPSPQTAPEVVAYKSGLQSPLCDYSIGRWVPSDAAHRPLYNSSICGTIIKEGRKCTAHGRPDTGYLHWQWQPDKCDLPAFDPSAFLSLIRNKHLAFIGDSLARNQLESLICLLSISSSPELVYHTVDNKFRRWTFPTYNATVSNFWSPFLVRGIEKSPDKGIDYHTLYLDNPDENWVSEISHIDIAVVTAGHWFWHPAIYHERDGVLGCHYCPGFNYTEVSSFDVFRKALRTTLDAILGRSQGSFLRKNVVLTTFSPNHFEGTWDKGGTCAKMEPYKIGEKEVGFMDAEMRKIEMEEVAAAVAKAEVEKSMVRFQALDVTRMAMMRPDGHPGPYMHADPFAGNGPKDRLPNDCVHWCLPGPIDVWNEILLEMMH